MTAISADTCIDVDITVVIPSYNRGAVLLDTVQYLLAQTIKPQEIIIVDQTDYGKGDSVASKLKDLNDGNKIKWLRKSEPSIPKAMNAGLLEAEAQWVLFIDDDVNFADDFIRQHQRAIAESGRLAHVGQIVQPWQQVNAGIASHESSVELSAGETSLKTDLEFPFNSPGTNLINNCMAGNLCVNKAAAIAAGGFDENFSGAAYRFETEFCKRFCLVHKQLFFYSPKAVLHHLHFGTGGTRAHADFLTSSTSAHSMGDYYFAMLNRTDDSKFHILIYIVRRFLFSIVAKYYLRKPWFMVPRLMAEARGIVAARRALKKGPRLLDSTRHDALKASD